MTEKGIETKDAKREAIIAHNLEMMNGPMMERILRESKGGGAGDAESSTGTTYPCVTVNGYVDSEGRIILFGNIGSMTEKISSSEKRFGIDVALNKESDVREIVELSDRNDIGPLITSVLRESINRFNKMHQKEKVNSYQVLAEEVERINFEQRYPNREKPKVLGKIIELLRQGDIISARQTFNWEKDKLLGYDGLVPFLEEKLK